MEQQNQERERIAIGAVVEATNGLVGTVSAVVSDPNTGELSHLIVQNDNKDKEFTIPADLIAGQTGTQVVHLKIARDRLANNGVDIQVDTDTGNLAYPTPPPPQ